ncbi:ataxin-10-like [Dendronephthya gigantea]|uniref:ataxin-10-like n=1 Tax=Dendronephthya gigantea TaxID=151771 RepID=UPI00106B7ABB|nr:ataxin-10-like [Dendronephthya gigantea]XP_028405828.1 ataxin-10-like [Dendronephthya gigantea]XP_028405837.1 ataxin-10-like [Dendronephthya gigantea]
MAEKIDFQKWKYWCDILTVNSNALLPCVKWDDVKNALSGLKFCTKEQQYRSHITEEIINQCRSLIVKSSSLDFVQCCEIQADAFRFLRNCCAGSKKLQDHVMFYVFSILMEMLEKILAQNKDSDVVLVKQVLISGIQLLGNLVVDHEENQEIVWMRCSFSFFLKIMKCPSNDAKNCICMVIYNCMRKNPRTELCTTDEGLSLINEIIKMCWTNESNIEWGIFIIESSIQNGSFQQIYVGVRNNDLKLFLLELIEYKLKANQTYDHCISWISLDNALYIAKTFEENISKILNAEMNFDEESSSEVILVNALLRLLCILTSFPEEYDTLRQRKCLLETTLFALRETSTEANRKFFSDLSKFSNPSDRVSNSTHPAFGFKRGLIQLTANTCFHNRTNQDCVRHMGCIPLLLDHCNVDDYNPYICQWAIFCLRNLLEDNHKNQDIIKSLTKLGMASNSRLTEAGFVVEETKDGKLKITGKQNQDPAL